MATNQCDGCRRGIPLVDGRHTGPGGFWAGDVQACTADRYVDNPAPPEVQKLIDKANRALVDIAETVEKVRIADLVDGAQLRRRMTVKTIPGVNLDVALTHKGIEIKVSFSYIAVGEYTAEYLGTLQEPLIDLLNREAAEVIDLCLEGAKAEIETILKANEEGKLG